MLSTNGPSVILRDYQNYAVDTLWNYFHENTGNPLCLMPTGTGKSLVIGGLTKRAFFTYPGQRWIMATHVEKLVDQNADKLLRLWPQAPLGIHSEGLRRRDVHQDIIYGGIQSMIHNVELFGFRDILLVDEAHLIGPNEATMYIKFIRALMIRNPKLKVIGFTATGFRLGFGMLTDWDARDDEGPKGIFTDVAVDLTTMAAWDRFFAEDYLVPPIPHRTETRIDASNVGINTATGDYKQGELEKLMDTKGVIMPACREMVRAGEHRRCWLIFNAGNAKADETAEILRSYGINAASMHTGVPKKERDRRWAAFKAGELRALTNNNMATTGVDHPPIDMIGMLRPTISTGLWVQMLGRGTRPYPEGNKINCLVLDFARNVEKLGPINDPNIPKKKGQGGGDVPIKLCIAETTRGDVCGAYNHISARFCIECGSPFEIKEKLVPQLSGAELVRSSIPETKWFNVNRAVYQRHTSRNSGNEMIRVDYTCGVKLWQEYIDFEATASGFKHRTHEWWRRRYNENEQPVPQLNEAALEVLWRHPPRTPARIKIWTNTKFPEIVGTEF